MTRLAALTAEQPVQFSLPGDPPALRPFDRQLVQPAGRVVVELVPLEDLKEAPQHRPSDPLVEFKCEV